jgi:hypothetical protein
MNKNQFSISITIGIAIVFLLMGVIGASTAHAQSVTLDKPYFVEKENNKVEKKIDPNTTLFSYTGNGTINDNIEVTDTGKFLSFSKGNDLTFDKGEGVVKTKDGSESANYTFIDVGKGKDFQGAIAYSTNSTGKLSFMNNLLGIYKGQAGENDSFVLKEWEWK